MIRSTSGIPSTVLMPANWDQWKVFAYRGKRGDIPVGEVFVRAASEAKALEIGKAALRTMGHGGRYVVNARPYYPWFDFAFQGYIGYSANG